MNNVISPDANELTPQMTLLEIMYRWRASETVFRAYESQAGVCLRCQALFDSLEEVARKYRLDLQALLQDLQRLIQTAPSGASEAP